MRSDMAKVIVERPRFGSRRYGARLAFPKRGYRRYLKSMPVEEMPICEPMLGRWKGRSKDLNEHLGPMRRFLRSNIGRPWNKVHQELCEHVSFDNAVQAHVLFHIYEYVQLHVEVEDKATVYRKTQYGGWSRYKLGEDTMYVCPNSGILKVVQANRRHPSVDRIRKDEEVQYLKRDNVWWEVHLRSTENVRYDRWDVWLECNISQLTQQDCIRTYGDNLFATSKRLLTPHETRQLYREIRQKSRGRYGSRRIGKSQSPKINHRDDC